MWFFKPWGPGGKPDFTANPIRWDGYLRSMCVFFLETLDPSKFLVFAEDHQYTEVL